MKTYPGIGLLLVILVHCWSLPAIARPPSPSPILAFTHSSAQPTSMTSTLMVGVRADGVSATSLQAALSGATRAPSIHVVAAERLFDSAPLASASMLGLSHDLRGLYRLRVTAAVPLPDVLAALRALPAIAFAEPDAVGQILATPTDPLYDQQRSWMQIDAPAAWDVSTGTAEMTIAVIDSGIDTTHPDLAAQLWNNPGEIAGNGLDDDNNGYIDDVHGWNFVEDTAELADTTGHGTEVAGILAATANNGVGIAGTCWQCRLMIIKVVQPNGIANYSDIVAGIAYATQKGARVINMSLGGTTNSITLQTAIHAAAPTAVLVGGAGNGATDSPIYPAAYPDVLAVAGVDANDIKTPTSAYGPWVDLAAPGAAVMTTVDGGTYGHSSGTSMAAPFVAGVAALLRSAHPTWSPALIGAQLRHTADALDALNPLYAGQLGAGRLNAGTSVHQDPQIVIALDSALVNHQPDGALTVGASNDVAVNLTNHWAPVTAVHATLTTTETAVTIVQGSASWGAIDSSHIQSNAADPFRLTIAPTAYGQSLRFLLHVTADGQTMLFPLVLRTESMIMTISGTLAHDTHWTADRQYHVTGNVIVSEGVTLTIDPGTTILVDARKAFSIRGTLIASGTAEAPIHVTAAITNPPLGYWGTDQGCNLGGFQFQATSTPAQYASDGSYLSGSVIRHTLIDYSTGISLINASPLIEYNDLRGSGFYSAICLNGAASTTPARVRFNRITDGGGGIAIVGLSGAVTHNLIANNLLPAMLLFDSGATGDVSGNTLVNNGTTEPRTGCWQFKTTICLTTTQSVPFTHNNIVANRLHDYDVALPFAGTGIINLPANYWGTTDATILQDRIYDSADDLQRATVTLDPLLTVPYTDAPAFVTDLQVHPEGPVGIEPITLEIHWSAPMDESINPDVTFGTTAPYTSYPVLANAMWVSPTLWRATYDITSLVPRGSYTVQVAHARGQDALEVAPDTRFSFVVAYAGQISDQTPPPTPLVWATGIVDDPTIIDGWWTSRDPDSAITRYRYAIGSSPGARDLLDWTTTTTPAFHRSLAGIANDHAIWVMVQSQNAGGLWSVPGYQAMTPGHSTAQRVFLPLQDR